MASNQETLVTVFGGSGFLGRNVVRALAKRDYRIRVAVRQPELAGHLQPLLVRPDGQVDLLGQRAEGHLDVEDLLDAVQQRHRQLAGAEVGAEVPADLPHRVDQQLADLLQGAVDPVVALQLSTAFNSR